MKDIVKEQVAAAGVESSSLLDQPFDYLTRELSERDI